MNPSAACARDDADSKQDHGSDRHPKLGRSQFDRSPRESSDQNQDTEDEGEKSHRGKWGYWLIGLRPVNAFAEIMADSGSAQRGLHPMFRVSAFAPFVDVEAGMLAGKIA